MVWVGFEGGHEPKCLVSVQFLTSWDWGLVEGFVVYYLFEFGVRWVLKVGLKMRYRYDARWWQKRGAVDKGVKMLLNKFENVATLNNSRTKYAKSNWTCHEKHISSINWSFCIYIDAFLPGWWRCVTTTGASKRGWASHRRWEGYVDMMTWELNSWCIPFHWCSSKFSQNLEKPSFLAWFSDAKPSRYGFSTWKGFHGPQFSTAGRTSACSLRHRRPLWGRKKTC